MAHWERVTVPPDFAGATRAERQGGTYLRYHPDLLNDVSNALSPEVTEYAADVTQVLSRLGRKLHAHPLPILYSTSVRSEAISSSWIEGIRETSRAVALAQIADDAASHVATQIVRNVAAMRDAIELLGQGAWEHDHILRIHHDLLPWHPADYRHDQVWTGGTNKFNAQYAGPPAHEVHPLVSDLLDYANSTGDLPVVQAAVVHAQFETIHPFSDGNGRVGRALVHGILTRSGLVEGGVIPLSSVLRQDVKGYTGALTTYRYDGNERSEPLTRYTKAFLAYVEAAARLADSFVDAASRVHQRWQASVTGVRSDASLLRAIDLLVENPVVSARYLSEQLDVSVVTATKLVHQLEAVRILKPATGKYRRSALYQADEILRLLDFGSESGPGATAPAPETQQGQGLLLRCGAATSHGPCRNRVSTPGHCWRHRTPQT